MAPVSQVGKQVVAAAAWAERVRPRWYVTWVLLAVVGVVLDHVGVVVPRPVQAVVLAGLALLYLLPLAVAVVRNFREGFRGDDPVT
jgi:hypothetical protein